MFDEREVRDGLEGGTDAVNRCSDAQTYAAEAHEDTAHMVV